MLEVNGILILDDEINILNELKRQLELNGRSVFHKFIVGSNNIQTTCPFHKDGNERKPSFGILTADSGNYKAGTCHCFACGWSGSFAEMVSNCFGYDDLGLFGQKWLAKNFLTISIENREDIDLDLSRDNKKEKINYITESELDGYRYYHPYMFKRKMNEEVIDIFDIGYDDKTKCITFPVRDEAGSCLFVARRSVNTKYFNYPESVNKPVYGLYELSRLENYPKEIIICESMINAITCWVYGKYAVALNGTGTSYQFEQLKKLPCRKYVLGLDPDSAGDRGCMKIKKALPNKLLSKLIIPVGKDINDLTEEEFNNLKEILI